MKKLLVSLALIGLLLVGVYFVFPGKALVFFALLERAASGLEEKSVVVDGNRWVYLEGGEGPPLVLVHGFGGDKDNWTRVARSLTPHYRVIIPDLLGAGDSDKPLDRDYDIFSQAQGLRGFVHAMGPKRIHIGGNSMGGAISAVYAARWADEVDSVWLLNPGGVKTEARSEMRQMLEAGKDNPLVVETADDIRRLMQFTMSNPPPLPDRIATAIGKRALERRAMNDHIFPQLATSEELVMAAAPAILAPTLIVWGEQDRVLHPDGAVVLNKRIPNSRVIMMPDTGHLPMIEFPEQTAQDYLEFRAALPARR